jgi:tetratricopeptide (TPR) repeat protein
VPPPVQSEVTQLLKRGLNHYGLGDLEAAIASWEQALAIDPKNRAALDYIKSAREEAAQAAKSRPAKPAAKPAAKAGAKPAARPARKPAASPESDDRTPRTLDAVLQSVGAPTDDRVVQALALYKEGQLEEAYARLQQVAAVEPNRLDVEAYLSMIRGKLARGFAKEVGDQGRALRLIMSMDKLKKFDLRPDEGYLIAQIDGSTSIDQLLSMARDRVRALEIIARLLRDRIVE